MPIRCDRWMSGSIFHSRGNDWSVKRLLYRFIFRLSNCGGLILSALAVVVAVAGAGGSSAAREVSACGPFGDPPARLIEAVNPDCGIGELLGPWKDGDG